MGEVQSNQVEPSIWREWGERVVRRGEERERERERGRATNERGELLDTVVAHVDASQALHEIHRLWNCRGHT